LFEPEELRLNPKTFQEDAPVDHDDKQLIETTKSLLIRKWADIDFFITSEKDKYKDGSKIKCFSLTDFFVEVQGMPEYRHLMNDFVNYYINKKDHDD